MKGRGRVKRFPHLFVLVSEAPSWKKARASEEPGSTLAKPSEGLGVDADDEQRILEWTTPMGCYKFPSRFWGLSQVPGQPAIHSSIADMMGFGHDPTGSIRFPGRAM